MRYYIWTDYEEQWDANSLPSPEAIIESMSPSHAAEKFANTQGGAFDDTLYLIVRAGESDAYFRIEVKRVWECDLFQPTTLQELCAP